MPIKYFFELVILSALWGASFLFMRTTTGEFGPVMLITLRTGIAALALLPFFIYAKLMPQVLTHWRAIFFVGLTNTAIPFCLLSYSAFSLGAGYASILNATAPMFGAIVGYFWLKDNLPHIGIFGLIIGFIGVVVLSLAKNSGTIEAVNAWLPIVAALCATFLYGLAACYTKKYLKGVNALAIATGSQVFSVLSLFPLSLFFWPQSNPSLESWGQVLVLGLLCTAVAYILYFRLIANIGAEKAITVAYLIPVFGVLWGIVFLQESLTVLMWLGASFILLGVALTTGLIKSKRWQKSVV
ncbi:DMT family transporter [Paraglaciecola aestuariivivens]